MRARIDRLWLDTRARRLVCDGHDVHLSPKAFDLLALLVARRPAVVAKGEIREQLWPGVHVVDASLGNLVTEVRRVFEAISVEAGLIRTVHGVGYAFAGEVEEVADSGRAGPPSREAAFWVVVDDRRVSLVAGANLIGRDATCLVWIDSSGVSRRHACIRVPEPGAPGAASIEDLGSTNGTYLRGRRISGRADLQDGDRLRIGDVTLGFRAPSTANAKTKRVRARTP